MKKEFLAPAIITIFTIIAGAILLSTNVTADTDVVDVMTLGVPESCTMSGTGMNSHTDEIENGTYSSDIGTTTLHVFCNDNAGFAIYAVGYTDNEFGKNVLTNSTLGSAYDIVTGTADSGNTSNWAMKLAINQDSGDTTGTNAFALDNNFGGYHNVPSTFTKVAHKNTSTDMTNTTGGVKLTTTYAVLISANQAAGTYTGQVKYTLVHPASEVPPQPQTATSGCINYFPNGSGVVGTMGCQSISSSNTTKTLLPSNFSREGYGFAGWNDKYDYTGNFYGPQEDITFTAGQYTGSNNGLALYAVWVKSVGSLQDTSKIAALCGISTGSLTTAPTDGTANLSSVSALTDQRDNQTYAIAKLADGKCWMIENLRLEAESTRTTEKQALAQGYGTSTTYGNFSGLADAESTGFFYSYSANSLYSNDGSNNTINIGTSYEGYRMPRYNNYNNQSSSINRPQNPATHNATNNNTHAGIYGYGNYYTWAAAMANTTFYSLPTSTDANNKTSETANTSLCPSGWRLPYGRNSDNGAIAGGFSYLDIRLGGTGSRSDSNTNPTGAIMSNKWRSFPNNFLFSGDFYTSSIYGMGANGNYWSSTSSDSNGAYYLSLDKDLSRVTPGQFGHGKYYGDSIRCTANL